MNSLMKRCEGRQLEIIKIDGEPLFRLSHVCKILSINHVATVKKRLDDDVVSDHIIKDSIGRDQRVVFVNEDGLYDVILDSRKPEAKRFRKWITSKVLPTIRKTGGYQVQAPMNEKQQLMAAIKLTSINAEETEELKQVTAKHSDKIIELENKVENEITLQHGEQRRLQKAVGSRVYKLADNDLDEKRQELQSAIWYIEHWIPRKVLV